MFALASMFAGCSGSDNAAGTPVGTSAPPAGTDPPDFVRNPGESSRGSGDVGASAPDASGDSPTTIAVVPDTGVPGIDSEDVFCRSWSEFAGSFRALGLVSALGAPAEAMRLEVLASSAVVDAVAALGEHLPAELEPEREVLLEDFAGPFARRAARAHAELIAAGLDGALLGAAWLEQLTLSGIDDPEISVALPAGADTAAFDGAVEAFVAAVPPITQDPGLVTGADIPATEAYLAANCPDQGILGGNDDVSS